MATIVWLRRDLRLDDQPLWAMAASLRRPVIPVYIHQPASAGDAEAPGAAAQWWLHHSLASLDQALRARGSRLILRLGQPHAALTALAKECQATSVLWEQRYEPQTAQGDARLAADLGAMGCRVQSVQASLLFSPSAISNQAGEPYRVYTAFWRRCLSAPPPPRPVEFGGTFASPAVWPETRRLDELGLKPKRPWDQGLAASWTPGAAAATDAMGAFANIVPRYLAQRDLPGQSATSRLSPYLALGELSPRRLWYAFGDKQRAALRPGEGDGVQAYLRQLGWREFAHHLLAHYPATVTAPMRPEFEDFPWQEDGALLAAWQRGQTGYPIVDAGMRELWHSGWMHGRVRMIVGSFLVKDLLQPWQSGARWFQDTLVDFDLANNTMGWQWIAGCGADAAPFFRVFNPASQSRKFDDTGAYIRRWCPELARLPDALLHEPHLAPASELKRAGIILGQTYPRPIVEHKTARLKALVAYAKISKKRV